VNINLKINLEAIAMTCLLVSFFILFKNTEKAVLIGIISIIVPPLFVAFRIDNENKKESNKYARIRQCPTIETFRIHFKKSAKNND